MPAASYAGGKRKLPCGLHCSTLVCSLPYTCTQCHRRTALEHKSVHVLLGRKPACFTDPAPMISCSHSFANSDSTFVCRYSTNFADPASDVQALLADLQSIYNTYQKPLWLTEFAQIAFGGTPMFPTYDQQLAFMSAAVPALEAVTYLERFAWYALFPDQMYSNNTAALYDNGGSPTPAGTLYATF